MFIINVQNIINLILHSLVYPKLLSQLTFNEGEKRRKIHMKNNEATHITSTSFKSIEQHHKST